MTAIQTQYVEPVESDRMVYSAINGMLQTLDPHSSFMDPRSYAQMRERQEGRYYGLGLTIQSVDGDITAVRVFEGSPAFKNGMRRGDIVREVNGVPIERTKDLLEITSKRSRIWQFVVERGERIVVFERNGGMFRQFVC